MKEEPPIMRQYKALKRELPEYSILALKLGDFYEMFDHDAVRASSIIGATLTTRCGVAMCGFPQHTLMDCVAKLKAANQTFAIAEEMEGKTQKRGIIRREVTRIFNPEDNNKQKGTETMNTPTQNKPTTETTTPGKVVVVSVDDGDEEQTPVSEPQSTIEEQAATPKKAKRIKPLTPAECEKWQQRQRERIEREQAAVRVIKKLAPQIWHDDWWLKPLDWLEAKATELREAADAAKSAKDKKAA